jgi:translation initiation factor eIF-2B subunit alpha
VHHSINAAKQFKAAGIPTSIILDCAVGAFMDQVDLVIVGAEGVMENGGIINKVSLLVVSSLG